MAKKNEAKTPAVDLSALYADLKQSVEAIADDVAKAADGNNAAGVRVRKAMQEAKQKAQAVRVGVSDLKSAAKE